MTTAARRVRLPSGLPDIRAEYWDALQTGELIRDGKHATRSAIAAACARAGYTLAQFAELIGYAESGRALFTSRKLIDKHYRDAVRLVQSTPLSRDREANRQELAMIRSTLGRWRGRNAVRDRAVLDAVHAHADGLGLLVLALPLRDVAIWSGMTFERTRRALEALSEHGWLQVATKAHGREAARYRLALGSYDEVEETDSEAVPLGAVPFRVSSVPDQGPTGLVTRFGTPAVAHDLWAGQEGALTAADRHLYSLLGDIPATVSHLLAVSGMSRRTLYRRLRALQDAGLAAKQGSRYVRVVCDDFDALLAALGAKPVLAEREARYRDQQAAWSARHPRTTTPTLRLVSTSRPTPHRGVNQRKEAR
ncbi:hypothetical protein ACFWQL_11745 [Amycolatopsis thermoflava]|uniref:hypothetical protein n=1 Tax=Amycolatopsis thermoflava TaxID=84480 RepID=UPI0036488E96